MVNVAFEIPNSCAAVLMFVLLLITSCISHCMVTASTFCLALLAFLYGILLETKYIFLTL
jgi:hypothetical protein